MNNVLSAGLLFSFEDCEKMKEPFKSQFIFVGRVARIVKYTCSDGSPLYELIYKRNGYNIAVGADNIPELVSKFIEKANELCEKSI